MHIIVTSSLIGKTTPLNTKESTKIVSHLGVDFPSTPTCYLFASIIHPLSYQTQQLPSVKLKSDQHSIIKPTISTTETRKEKGVALDVTLPFTSKKKENKRKTGRRTSLSF